MRNFAALILTVMVLASCASISPEQCRAGDWRGIGISDGKQGRTNSYIAEHQKACSEIGIVPDVQAWLAGREIGVKEYCTPQNAYQIGRNGTTLTDVCTGPNVTQLNAANIKGQKYHAINREISQLRTRSNDIDTRKFFIGTPQNENEIRELRDLNREQSRIKTRISDLEIDKISYSAL